MFTQIGWVRGWGVGVLLPRVPPWPGVGVGWGGLFVGGHGEQAYPACERKCSRGRHNGLFDLYPRAVPCRAARQCT